jgi:hypothetical protein
MVEKPIVVLPLVWTFVLTGLPQLLQNLAVKLAIDGLTRETIPWKSKKTINMDLALLQT